MLMPFPARISQTIHPAPKFFGLHHSHDCRWWGARSKVVFPPLCAIGAGNGAPSGDNVKKRQIAEHIILLRTNPNISDAEEKDMLDYLYTCQYQMRGILTVSLGRIEDPNSENFTHAVFMRFQQKEDIAKFQSSAYYSKVLDGYVKPVSYGLVSVDFESEVEDDIIPLFRRGEVAVLIISTIGTVMLQSSVFHHLTTSNCSGGASSTRICGHRSFVSTLRGLSTCISSLTRWATSSCSCAFEINGLDCLGSVEFLVFERKRC
ncbi:uncharacterized protein LOC124692045 isoform X3 [Lolium rigidum]|uniref:uncharacterized protein LOC124692045 isoform X3 n=1 Tax=Lolium rigidum TaxID=89674 RepID=UPI001F5CA36C|nr:uncharacterized protein LOC124692045 isoform X3 [Lolium rigidum]